MKTLVVYKSKTGYTETYAKWIAQAIACDCKPLKNIKSHDLSDYDHIIYGGGVYASKIAGVNKIKKLARGQLTIFAVGLTAPSDDYLKTLRQSNFIQSEELFYMPGGVDLDKLGFFLRFMMKQMKKSIENKDNPSQEDLDFIKALDGKGQAIDQTQIEPLVNYIREME